jgi:hypothetical protein
LDPPDFTANQKTGTLVPLVHYTNSRRSARKRPFILLKETKAGCLTADLEHAFALRFQFQYARLDGRLNPSPAELGPIRPRGSNATITAPRPDAFSCRAIKLS